MFPLQQDAVASQLLALALQSLVDLAEERPKAMQLMRGRNFARALH